MNQESVGSRVSEGEGPQQTGFRGHTGLEGREEER
jgi:hypothetical protein